MKKSLAIVLIAILAIGACRKNDKQTFPSPNDNVSGTTSNVQIIATKDIERWFAKSPAGPYFNVDWGKAKQADIGGVGVVALPITGIKETKEINSNLKTQGLRSLSQTIMPGFNVDHPPVLYFFKTGGGADTVKALLMNFVPDNPTKENGEHNIWTGKLIEWNFQTDTALYQQLNKSYTVGLGKFVIGQNKQTDATHIKINSFWTLINAIGNAIVDAINAVGYFLGVPGDYGATYPGVIISGWCDFLWGAFCDNGGPPEGGGGAYYNAAYGFYIPGYNGDNSGANWNPQPTPTLSELVYMFCQQYNLAYEQQSWLIQHPDAFDTIKDLFSNLQLSDLSKADFSRNIIGYLIDNPTVDGVDCITQFYATQTFDINSPYVSAAANEYKFDDTANNFPRFKKLLNQLPQYLIATPAALASIMRYTGYTKAQVLQMVAPGQGPEIVLQELPDGLLGHYSRSDNFGNKTPKPDVFYISASYVRGLENANLTVTLQGTAFLLAVTIFHESVHLGRNMNNLLDPDRPEYGDEFEKTAFKVVVTSINANHLVNYNFSLK